MGVHLRATETVPVTDLHSGDHVWYHGVHMIIADTKIFPGSELPVLGARADMITDDGEPMTRETLPPIFYGLTSWRLADGRIVRSYHGDVPASERMTATAVWWVQGNERATIRRLITADHREV
jgi:hypothetical protein